MPIPMPAVSGCCMNVVSALLTACQRIIPLPASRFIDPDRSSITKMSSGTGSALFTMPTHAPPVPPVPADPPLDDDDDTKLPPPPVTPVDPPAPPSGPDVDDSWAASHAASASATDVMAP